jgi:hypothetical protein
VLAYGRPLHGQNVGNAAAGGDPVQSKNIKLKRPYPRRAPQATEANALNAISADANIRIAKFRLRPKQDAIRKHYTG